MTDKKTTEKKETETAATFTEELTAVLEEIKEEPVKEKKKGYACIGCPNASNCKKHCHCGELKE